MRYLDSAEISASRLPGAAHLRIEIADDRCVLAARIKCAFPLSRPAAYISIQDGAGKEVGVLRTLDGLSSGTRALFDAQLDRTYFTPKILQIHVLRQEAGMWKFAVTTQRGPTEFFVRNWRDSAVEIAPGRWQILSVDGGRFEIENLESLDAPSRRFLDQLL